MCCKLRHPNIIIFFLLSPILEEVSKPQAAGKAVEAVEAEKTESAEAKTEAAQSS
jgi:hypothetical protein